MQWELELTLEWEMEKDRAGRGLWGNWELGIGTYMSAWRCLCMRLFALLDKFYSVFDFESTLCIVLLLLLLVVGCEFVYGFV